jgi:hypothetical protein
MVANKILLANDRRLDMLNVKYVVVTTSGQEYEMFLQHPERFSQVFKKGKTVVFENKTALPRAFLVGAGGILPLPGDMEQIEAIKDPSFDPLRSVVLASLPTELAELRQSAEFVDSVAIVGSNVNGYHFRVQASAPGILVVSFSLPITRLQASLFPQVITTCILSFDRRVSDSALHYR